MNKRRIFIYIGCMIAIIFLTIYKQGIITAKRKQEVITSFSEWQIKGRPVVVDVARSRDISLYTKITIVPVSGNAYESFVPKAIQMKLQAGQLVSVDVGEEKINGKIIEVENNVDIESGMFRIKLSLEKEENLSVKSLVVYVKTGVLLNVLCVPNEVIAQEGDGYLLWVVRDGKAHKQVVTIEQRDGYGAIIKDGLKSGDLVIIEGFTQLYENDKVNILTKEEAKEI